MPANLWMRTLKIWNAYEEAENPSHKYLVPKKGTEAYDEVRELMDYLKENPSMEKTMIAELGKMTSRKRKGKTLQFAAKDAPSMSRAEAMAATMAKSARAKAKKGGAYYDDDDDEC